MKNITSPTKHNHAQLIDGLAHLLADTYILTIKTQNFHWNVRGPNFYTYHKMFEEQYNQLALAIDELAERMRALNVLAPASYAQFMQLSSLKETSATLTDEEMIKALLKDHESMSEMITRLFSIAEACEDEVTLDFFIQRKTEHDKIAWMLRSTLGKI